jgi:catechol 2,3-dioxygenase-like lactoylglutathione lyase family enzyme
VPDWLLSEPQRSASRRLHGIRTPAHVETSNSNIFVKDLRAALAYYTGPLGFNPLFVCGNVPFYAHVARNAAILALRHVSKSVIDHTSGEDLLSAFIEISDVNALHQQLQTAGACIWQAPRDEPWAMRSLIVRDLDDNLICFASNLSAAGAA